MQDSIFKPYSKKMVSGEERKSHKKTQLALLMGWIGIQSVHAIGCSYTQDRYVIFPNRRAGENRETDQP